MHNKNTNNHNKEHQPQQQKCSINKRRVKLKPKKECVEKIPILRRNYPEINVFKISHASNKTAFVDSSPLETDLYRNDE